MQLQLLHCFSVLYLLVLLVIVFQNRGGQIVARGSHVAHHIVFSGPRKHSGKLHI